MFGPDGTHLRPVQMPQIHETNAEAGDVPAPPTMNEIAVEVQVTRQLRTFFEERTSELFVEQIVDGTFAQDVGQIVEVSVPQIMEDVVDVGGETTPCAVDVSGLDPRFGDFMLEQEVAKLDRQMRTLSVCEELKEEMHRLEEVASNSRSSSTRFPRHSNIFKPGVRCKNNWLLCCQCYVKGIVSMM